MMTPATGFQKLRFHADDGSEFPEWNKKKLSEVFSKITRKNVDRKIELVLTNSAEHGIIPQREFFDKDIASVENIDGYYILNPNDFVYNPRKSKAAPYGPFQCYYGEIPGVVSPLYTCLHPITKDCSQYLMRYFASAAWHRFVYDNGSVGARHDRVSMTDDILFNIPVEIPCLEEQQKIADFLSAYDKKISLQRERVETLKEQKKGLLQKMFPKKGETVPELRFPGFTGDWEQRKAIDIADYSKGNGYSKGDLTDAGTPIILYGRLYTKYQFAISEVDTFAVPRNGAVYSQGNEVIVPASGETAEDIARASAVEKSGVLLGGDLNILRPFDFINPLFLALAISNGEPQKELAKKAQGKSVVHIHNTDIQEVTIAYPSRTEQDRIVSVFRQLDNLITLHQRKLETMQEIKKGLLQQMFV